MTIIARYDARGAVTKWDAKKKGTLGALGSWFGNQEGFMKTFSTFADVVDYTAGRSQISVVNLAKASDGFKTAGGACALSKAAVAWVGVVGDVSGKKLTTAKGLGNASKAVSETAELLVCVKQMGGLTLSEGATQLAKKTKGVFTLAADGFNLYETAVVAPLKMAERAQYLSEERVKEEQKENWYATVRSIIAIGFHAYLFIGAVFLIPLEPLAITVFASIYIVALTVHHFVKSSVDDKLAVYDAGVWTAGLGPREGRAV